MYDAAVNLFFISVAHSEVYGYGFRPYEFLSPCQAGTVLSTAQTQEAALGMYSLRSFLYPRIYVALFEIKELLGLKCTPFLVSVLVGRSS